MFRSSRGSILVLALWSVMLFSVLVVAVGFGARQKAVLFTRLQNLDRLPTIAWSGVETAKSLLKSDVDVDFDAFTDGWAASSEGAPAGGRFVLVHSEWDESKKAVVEKPGLVDEARKINLNTADAETLVRLFKAVADLSQEEAEEIAYPIVDWRDSDSGLSHPQYGAEGDVYEDLPLPYQAKNAPIELVDELLLVKSVKREFFDKIRPFVTVYGAGPVNVNTAPRPVLLALGLSESAVEKILKHRAGPDGQEGTPDDRFFANAANIAKDMDNDSPPLDGAERTAVENLASSEKLGIASAYFGVESRAVLDGSGLAMTAEAVFERSGKVVYSRFSEIR